MAGPASRYCPLSPRSESLVCLILAALFACAGCTGSAGDAAGRLVPAFTRDVAPILFEHCAPCHRSGQGAPFSLLTYDDARRRATEIARAVATGHMPPWLPEPGTPAFAGERRLNPNQVATIRRWADEGTPEGPRAALPPPPAFTDGWQLGQPDLVVTLPRPYVLAPGDGDVFRNVVLPVALSETRDIRAVEFHPGGAPVHHAVVHIDRTSASRRRDGADGQPGFDGMGARDAQDPEGHFLGWAPGRGPIVAPDGMPWRLERGTDLVLELHLIPAEQSVSVQPKIALYFADQPATDVPVMLKMGSKAIDIPAGEANYAIEDTFTLPADIELLSLYPHAHYLGKEMSVTATLPGGETRSLLHIKQWNFRWQQDYRYVAPVTLPRGTTLRMRFTYDNSSTNEHNPNRPPRQVMCGQQSTDEMGNLGVQMLRAIERRTTARRRGRGGQGDARQRRGCRDARAQQPGQRGESGVSRRQLRGRRPGGGRLAPPGRGDSPRSAFRHGAQRTRRRAHRGRPRAGGARRVSTGLPALAARRPSALQRGPRARRAEPDGRGRARVRARARPESGFCGHPRRVGAVLFAQGRIPDAIAHLTRAVALSPDSARLQSDLGGALAQAGRFTEALAHVRRALTLDPTYEAGTRESRAPRASWPVNRQGPRRPE